MIRLANERDYNKIRQLIDQIHSIHVINRPDIYREDNIFTEELFNKLLRDPLTFVTVYDEDGIKGTCCMTVQSIENKEGMVSRKRGWIEDICVDEKYRNQGIGYKLFNDMKERAIKEGAEAVELMVWSFNHTAIEFYEKAGMSTRSRIMEIKL